MTVEVRGYIAGALWAAHFIVAAHDQPSMAGEMLRSLLGGYSESSMRYYARREGVTFPRGFWKQEVFRHGRS